jgi:hypothetical protein
MRWSWSVRCLEWDRHVQRQDDEAMVRYRVAMNERQRAASRLAQQKMATWLIELDPTRLTPHEAARWFEVAVRVEREAAGAASSPDLAPPLAVPDPFEGMTLAELLGVTAEAEVLAAAEEIFQAMRAVEDDGQG